MRRLFGFITITMAGAAVYVAVLAWLSQSAWMRWTVCDSLYGQGGRYVRVDVIRGEFQLRCRWRDEWEEVDGLEFVDGIAFPVFPAEVCPGIRYSAGLSLPVTGPECTTEVVTPEGDAVDWDEYIWPVEDPFQVPEPVSELVDSDTGEIDYSFPESGPRTVFFRTTSQRADTYYMVLHLRYWVLLILLGLWPCVALARLLLRPHFRRRRGLCLGCAYDLTGNVSGTCPECGREIERKPGEFDEHKDTPPPHESRH